MARSIRMTATITSVKTSITPAPCLKETRSTRAIRVTTSVHSTKLPSQPGRRRSFGTTASTDRDWARLLDRACSTRSTWTTGHQTSRSTRTLVSGCPLKPSVRVTANSTTTCLSAPIRCDCFSLLTVSWKSETTTLWRT